MLRKILQVDVQITKKFVDTALKNSALRSLRNHAKFLEVSCHGIVWLAGWLTFIWLFNNKDLYQVQVNMLIGFTEITLNKQNKRLWFFDNRFYNNTFPFPPKTLVSFTKIRNGATGVNKMQGALLLDIIVIAVVKAFVRRRRPVPMNKLTAVGPDKYSFPSGYASRSVLIAFILTCLSPVSFIFYPPLLAWVGSVCLSRVLLERHYFLDVLAGCSIGILEGLTMSLVWLSQNTSASILSSLSDEKLDGGEYHV